MTCLLVSVIKFVCVMFSNVRLTHHFPKDPDSPPQGRRCQCGLASVGSLQTSSIVQVREMAMLQNGGEGQNK